MELDAKVPEAPIEQMWETHREHLRLVGPRNRPRYCIIVVGTGLAGASAAASLGTMGYRVECFCFQDSPRRAHSIAAQGGINAAKNFRSDGDSVYRLFYDTQKGGDFRSREANVWRLAELSAAIIDQAVAQGVPFAREYGGLIANRSFGGVLVERTFYCRGETGSLDYRYFIIDNAIEETEGGGSGVHLAMQEGLLLGITLHGIGEGIEVIW